MRIWTWSSFTDLNHISNKETTYLNNIKNGRLWLFTTVRILSSADDDAVICTNLWLCYSPENTIKQQFQSSIPRYYWFICVHFFSLSQIISPESAFTTVLFKTNLRSRMIRSKHTRNESINIIPIYFYLWFLKINFMEEIWY